jgi:hypothetical protein
VKTNEMSTSSLPHLSKFAGAVGVLLLSLATDACGQKVYILGGNGDLRSIDPSSGVSIYIGDTGFHDYFWNGLSQDQNGRFVAAYGDFVDKYWIYEIDPTTGSGTPLVPTPFYGVESLSFGGNGELFVINDPKGPSNGGIHDLYTVDLATGSVNLIGSTGLYEIKALDFHNGILFGFDVNIGLVTIDTTTGVATDVNPNFRGSLGFTGSMCFDANGALYYIDHAIKMMDKDSGIYNPVRRVDIFGYWGEAEFMEGPAPHFSLWLDGTAGNYMGAKMTGATPNSQVMLMWAKDEGGPSAIPNGLPCAGTMMDLNFNLGKVSIADTDANGAATVGPGPRRMPAAAKGRIWLQAVDLATCQTSNRILLKH